MAIGQDPVKVRLRVHPKPLRDPAPYTIPGRSWDETSTSDPVRMVFAEGCGKITQNLSTVYFTPDQKVVSSPGVIRASITVGVAARPK